MTVGERVYRLRTERGMSQEELAGALRVSRQSVSKWETGGSVPELDKLVKLSELFGVTLDELVRGAPEEDTLPERPSAADECPAGAAKAAAPSGGARRIVGAALLLIAVVLALLPVLLHGSLVGLPAAVPFLLSGVVCLAVRRRAGLWCGWVWYLCLMLYFRYATGISWTLTLLTPRYQPEWNYLRLLIAWVMLVCMAVMLMGTLRAFRAVCIRPSRRRTALLAAGWTAWLVLPRLMNAVLFRRWLAELPHSSGVGCQLVSAAWGGLLFAACNVLAVLTLALLRGRWSADGERCH